MIVKIIKIIISLFIVAVCPFDTILWRIVMFPLIYGLITYYIWYFKNNDSTFRIYFGSGGFIATVFSFFLMLLMPVLILSVGFYIASLLGKVGTTIYSALLLIICYGHFFLDMIRIFKPSFLKDEDECTNTDPDCGFIDNDDMPK